MPSSIRNQLARAKRSLARRSSVALFSLVAACGFMRPAREPMERVSFHELGPDIAQGAIVLLPGFGDRPQAFAEHGFVAALRRQAPLYDVFGADAHFGYYRKHTVLDRLEHDVIGPLRARGYREIWLVGASMGGFGAVAYARTHPDKIRGLLLFAPYMGPDEVVSKVAAVGLCHYDETPGSTDDRANFARKNFLWLKQQACVDRRVSLFVGVGADDGLKPDDDVLSRALPASHRLVLPGGHGWKVWTAAVEQLAKTAFDSPENVH